MNQKLTINKEYWLERNPEIEFHRVKKAYYGTHLLKAKVHICGASMRYYQRPSDPPSERTTNPTYDEFMIFLRQHVRRFNMQRIIKVEDNRFIHCKRPYEDTLIHRPPAVLRIYDAEILYRLYNMLQAGPEGIRFSREYDTLHIYSNDINDLHKVLDDLQLPAADIKAFTAPGENDVELLLAGKEFNSKAETFKYKVFLKSVESEGIPDLANYLESIKDTGDVEVPQHCNIAIFGSADRWSWTYFQRSYLYVKDKDTILLIKLLAGNRYSNYIELILPREEMDK